MHSNLIKYLQSDGDELLHVQVFPRTSDLDATGKIKASNTTNLSKDKEAISLRTNNPPLMV